MPGLPVSCPADDQASIGRTAEPEPAGGLTWLALHLHFHLHMGAAATLQDGFTPFAISTGSNMPRLLTSESGAGDLPRCAPSIENRQVTRASGRSRMVR